MRWDIALILAALFGLLFSVGCSKTQTTVLLAERWETGQHRSCLYGHKNLYCFPADFLEKLPKEQRQQATPYFMEMKRETLLKDKSSDGGSYATKFISHTPMDFSTWDCYKTGAGSPAIVCSLTHKPTKEESAAFVKSEKEQEDAFVAERARKAELHRLGPSAAAYLRGLNPEDVVAACGSVREVRSVEQMFKVAKSEGASFGLYPRNKSLTFIQYPFALLNWMSSSLRSVTGTADFTRWYSTEGTDDDAAGVLQTIPCLFVQVADESKVAARLQAQEKAKETQAEARKAQEAQAAAKKKECDALALEARKLVIGTTAWAAANDKIAEVCGNDYL